MSDPSDSIQPNSHRPQPGDTANLPHHHSQEGGVRVWVMGIIAVIVVAILMHDRPITIAARDGDPPVLKSTPSDGFAGQAWAR